MLLRQSKVIRDHLNHRQLALVNHALKHPETDYTFQSHATSHNVAYATARTDLLDLTRHGLLVEGKVGRTITFSIPRNLTDRLSRLSQRLQGLRAATP